MGTDDRERLEEWKEISAYIQVHPSTAKRFHKHDGLPVHKRGFTQKARVFAYKSELDEWVKSKRNGSSAEKAGNDLTGADVGAPIRDAATPARPQFRPVWLWSVLLVAVIAGAFFLQRTWKGQERSDPEIFNVTSDPGVEEHPSLSPDAEQVSFSRPSGRLLTANMQSGGSSAKTLKKLKGAAFTTPVGPSVVTQAIGRGRTKAVRIL